MPDMFRANIIRKLALATTMYELTACLLMIYEMLYENAYARVGVSASWRTH
jgi:hypothetical protein